jgi:hypothetical protein
MKIVHFEFLEQGQTVNQHCYLEILARSREAVHWRRPELWPAWILHHDIAVAYDALTVWEFLAKKSIMKLDHQPYSPDLVLCSIWLFPKVKTTEWLQIFRHCQHSGTCDDHSAEHSRRGVPEMF